jgi:two-component system, LuxR family, sensor kinase FixL
MSKPDPPKRWVASALSRYGLALLCVAAAVLLTELLGHFIDSISLFFAAVAVSAWFGGKRPGLFAVLLATVAVNYYLIPPHYSFTLEATGAVRLVIFTLSALLIGGVTSGRRRAEDSLIEKRQELEARFRERTAEVERANEELQAEITQRKRAEVTLREQADLLNLTHDTIMVRDLNAVITFWNRGAEEMYQWTREEAIGQVSHDLLRTMFPNPLEQITAELIRTGRWEGELIHTRRDGTQVVAASRWALQSDEQGRPIATLEINNDITERKQAEEALRKAQQDLAHVSRVTALGELTASIAHEINQPLAAVVTNGNAGLRWLAASPNLDEARAALQRIIRDGNRASEVIKRIRALLKKSTLQKMPLDINEVVHEVLALTDNQVTRNRVRLQTELERDLPPVRGDRVQLQQVILNLMMNGIEAMNEVADRPRQMLIKTQRAESGDVLVAVRDSGVGLDPQQMNRLFQAFFTTKPQGMGMGLSISYSIIEAHGGQLQATPNPDHGATFHFTLPVDGRR